MLIKEMRESIEQPEDHSTSEAEPTDENCARSSFESDDDSASEDAGDDDSPRGLEHVLDDLRDSAEDSDDDQVSLGEVVDHIGTKAYGPLLLVPAFIALFPLTGGIPGASVVTGAWTGLVAIQMLFRSDGIWLPGFLRNRSIAADTVEKATEKAGPWVEWTSHVVRPRFGMLTGTLGTVLVAIVCLGLAATMFPLALVPMGVMIPSGVIFLLALGLTAGDGLLVGLGLIGSAVAGWGIWTLLG